MLIGHFAPALVLQRARPTTKLWWLFLATQWVDVMWAVFVLLGVEHVRIVPHFTASNDLDLYDMPYTHGLVATVAWSVAAFVVCRLLLRRSPAATADAAVIAIAVASHFVADLLVHEPDLPLLSAQGTKIGLGLWQHRWLAMGIEAALFGGASWVWWKPHRHERGARLRGAALLALTVVAAGTYFIPTPPTPSAMALMALATYAGVVGMAGWIGRHTSANAQLRRDGRRHRGVASAHLDHRSNAP